MIFFFKNRKIIKIYNLNNVVVKIHTKFNGGMILNKNLFLKENSQKFFIFHFSFSLFDN